MPIFGSMEPQMESSFPFQYNNRYTRVKSLWRHKQQHVSCVLFTTQVSTPGLLYILHTDDIVSLTQTT